MKHLKKTACFALALLLALSTALIGVGAKSQTVADTVEDVQKWREWLIEFARLDSGLTDEERDFVSSLTEHPSDTESITVEKAAMSGVCLTVCVSYDSDSDFVNTFVILAYDRATGDVVGIRRLSGTYESQDSYTGRIVFSDGYDARDFDYAVALCVSNNDATDPILRMTEPVKIDLDTALYSVSSIKNVGDDAAAEDPLIWNAVLRYFYDSFYKMGTVVSSILSDGLLDYDRVAEMFESGTGRELDAFDGDQVRQCLALERELIDLVNENIDKCCDDDGNIIGEKIYDFVAANRKYDKEILAGIAAKAAAEIAARAENGVWFGDYNGDGYVTVDDIFAVLADFSEWSEFCYSDARRICLEAIADAVTILKMAAGWDVGDAKNDVVMKKLDSRMEKYTKE